MADTIDRISINENFWFQIKSHLVSFGYKGLPDGTHFTIGFDERSPDINFHVTKNAIDPQNKPQIKIVVIDKQILVTEASSLTIAMLNTILKPLEIEEFRKKYDNDIGYISFESLQNLQEPSLIEQYLINSFKDISRRKRRTGLKVEGDIEQKLEAFASSEPLQQTLINNIVELPGEFEGAVGGGILLTKDNALVVMRISEKWFTFRMEITPFDILAGLVSPQLARQLVWKTKRALVAMKYAKKYSDTEHLNKPIRLGVQLDTNTTNQQELVNCFRPVLHRI